MKFPVSLIALAIAISAFAQTQTAQTPAKIRIKSKGEDIRTVIDSIFEQSGKQYVLETNVHQAMYMNLDGLTFEKAIEIVSNVGALEFTEKQGIWYVSTRLRSTKPTVSTTGTSTEKTATKAPAKSPEAKSQTIKTNKTEIKTATKSKSDTKIETAGQTFATISKPATPRIPALDLTKRLTVQLKKMDIREVFEEFGRQTKIDIEIDESVPNYKLDAYFYNTSLKFALDKTCKVAGLKYTMTPSKTLKISKA